MKHTVVRLALTGLVATTSLGLTTPALAATTPVVAAASSTATKQVLLKQLKADQLAAAKAARNARIVADKLAKTAKTKAQKDAAAKAARNARGLARQATALSQALALVSRNLGTKNIPSTALALKTDAASAKNAATVLTAMAEQAKKDAAKAASAANAATKKAKTKKAKAQAAALVKKANAAKAHASHSVSLVSVVRTEATKAASRYDARVKADAQPKVPVQTPTPEPTKSPTPTSSPSPSPSPTQTSGNTGGGSTNTGGSSGGNGGGSTNTGGSSGGNGGGSTNTGGSSGGSGSTGGSTGGSTTTPAPEPKLPDIQLRENVKVVPASALTAYTGSTMTLSSAATVGDIINVIPNGPIVPSGLLVKVTSVEGGGTYGITPVSLGEAIKTTTGVKNFTATLMSGPASVALGKSSISGSISFVQGGSIPVSSSPTLTLDIEDGVERQMIFDLDPRIGGTMRFGAAGSGSGAIMTPGSDITRVYGVSVGGLALGFTETLSANLRVDISQASGDYSWDMALASKPLSGGTFGSSAVTVTKGSAMTGSVTVDTRASYKLFGQNYGSRSEKLAVSIG